MRLRQLECFVRVCEIGSISRAAEQLNIAQPALGLQIKNLEHEFGATLLLRSSRGVLPTAAGEIVLTWAREMIEQTRAVKDRLRTLAQTTDPVVIRLGLTPTITILLAGAILEEAARRVPGLSLRIVEGLSHLVVGWIETEAVDLAIVSGNVEGRALAQEPILREPLLFVTKAGQDVTRGSIPLAEALAGTLAMPGDNDALRRIVEAEARRSELPLTVAYEIASIPAIKDLVRRGVANAILPFGAVQREVAAGDLIVRRFIEPSLWRTLTLVRASGRPVGSHERALVAVMRDCFASLLEDGDQEVAYEFVTD